MLSERLKKIPDRALCPFRLGGFFALSVNVWDKKDSHPDSPELDDKTKCENSYYCLGKKCRLWSVEKKDCSLCK
jgi:hypothetical protein